MVRTITEMPTSGNLKSGDSLFGNTPLKINDHITSHPIQILGENGINSKLKHRKAHNLILSMRFGDPYPGELACMLK